MHNAFTLAKATPVMVWPLLICTTSVSVGVPLSQVLAESQAPLPDEAMVIFSAEQSAASVTVPVNGTSVASPLKARFTLACLSPVDKVGMNCAENWHCSDGRRNALEEHPPYNEKSSASTPAKAMLSNFRLTLPVFSTVNVCSSNGPLPSVTVPKSWVVGETARFG